MPEGAARGPGREGGRPILSWGRQRPGQGTRLGPAERRAHREPRAGCLLGPGRFQSSGCSSLAPSWLPGSGTTSRAQGLCGTPRVRLTGVLLRISLVTRDAERVHVHVGIVTASFQKRLCGCCARSLRRLCFLALSCVSSLNASDAPYPIATICMSASLRVSVLRTQSPGWCCQVWWSFLRGEA